MLFIWFFSLFVTTSALFYSYPIENDILGGPNDDGRVIITPYIEAGKIDEVRKLTAVKPLKGEVVSYAGFVTVDKKCDSNLFFWYVPVQQTSGKYPVCVWLQGGPGASSLYGFFTENGPYMLKPNGKIEIRKYSWAQMCSYLFIDNPVGTGYSYTSSENCYSKNQEDVGKNLLSAVKQILKVFPEVSSNDFYITGESYAGKYVPALAYAIHKDTDTKQKINLQGLAIGNGLVDPFNQLIYSDYLYQLGLIDSRARDYFKKEENSCRQFISNENWMEAYKCFDNILNGDTVQWPTYFQNVTGFSYYFNYLYSNGQPEGNLSDFITRDYVRREIHVGNSTWHSGKTVEKYLMEDVMKSVRSWLEELLESYRVLIYNGQLDIIVAYPLTIGYLQKLNWSAAEEYKAAGRHIWRVDADVAGYVKSAGKLTEVLVRNAGHMVPRDQPKWGFDLISRWLSGKPFY